MVVFDVVVAEAVEGMAVRLSAGRSSENLMLGVVDGATLMLVDVSGGLFSFSALRLVVTVLLGLIFFFLSFRLSLALTSLELHEPWLLASIPLSPSSLSTVSVAIAATLSGDSESAAGQFSLPLNSRKNRRNHILRHGYKHWKEISTSFATKIMK